MTHNQSPKYLLYILLFFTNFTLSAAELPIHNTVDIKSNLDEDDSYWELDLGLSANFDKHYIQGVNKHEDGDLSSSVILSGGYYYHDFFFEVSPLIGRPFTFGYSLQRTKHFVVNLIAESLFQGFSEKSQHFGSQLTGINKRKTSLDGGIEMYYSHEYGETRFRALRDISNTHQGYIIAFDYAYPIFMKRWTIWPSYGVSWLSEDTTQYYFGIVPDESTVNRPIYKPRSAFTNKFNLYIAYQVNSHLSVVGYGDYTLFSHNINKSPLVAPNINSYRFGLGVMWSF